MVERIEALAYAKINLSLEITGKRDDGYHEIKTVLHTIDLADRLAFSPAERTSLQCDRPSLEDEHNLVLRTCRLIQEYTGYQGGAAISLQKKIPIAAGLGGGSSDSAATFKALNALWRTNLDGSTLEELALRLGSDIPFFLNGACALAQGRGEMLSPLPPVHGIWAVIATPSSEIANKTARLYSLLGESDFSNGSATTELAERIRNGGVTMHDIRAAGMNAFERVAGRAFSGLDGIIDRFLKAGAGFVRMSGSGPSLFTLTDDEDMGRHLLSRVAGEGVEAYMARLVDPQ